MPIGTTGPRRAVSSDWGSAAPALKIAAPAAAPAASMHMATKPLTHTGIARWVCFSQSGEGTGGGALDAHSAAPVFRSQLYQTNCTASLVSCRSRPAAYVAPAIPGVAACLCQAGCFAAPRPAFPPAPTCADLDIGHAAPGPPPSHGHEPNGNPSGAVPCSPRSLLGPCGRCTCRR